MPETLSIGERSTLEDISDPASCLIHDGPTIEALLSKGFIRWDDASSCLRITSDGKTALKSLSAPPQ